MTQRHAFEPGQEVVLKHNRGARLMTIGTVGRCLDKGLTTERWELFEVGPERQPQIAVWSTHVIATKDRDTAVALVANINLWHTQCSADIRRLETARDNFINILCVQARA